MPKFLDIMLCQMKSFISLDFIPAVLFHHLVPRLQKADLARSRPSHQISSRFVPTEGEPSGLSSNTSNVRPLCSGLTAILKVCHPPRCRPTCPCFPNTDKPPERTVLSLSQCSYGPESCHSGYHQVFYNLSIGVAPSPSDTLGFIIPLRQCIRLHWP